MTEPDYIKIERGMYAYIEDRDKAIKGEMYTHTLIIIAINVFILILFILFLYYINPINTDNKSEKTVLNITTDNKKNKIKEPVLGTLSTDSESDYSSDLSLDDSVFNIQPNRRGRYFN